MPDRKETPLKKKKIDRRTLWIRVMAILLALLMVGSVLSIILEVFHF